MKKFGYLEVGLILNSRFVAMRPLTDGLTNCFIYGTGMCQIFIGLSYGHTGHVRFLTSVEMWSTNSSSQKVDNSMGSTSFVHEEASSKSGIQHRSSVAAATSAIATRMLVISGGDGYEDLSSNPANETAGRDDSTNHLLLWQV